MTNDLNPRDINDQLRQGAHADQIKFERKAMQALKLTRAELRRAEPGSQIAQRIDEFKSKMDAQDAARQRVAPAPQADANIQVEIQDAAPNTILQSKGDGDNPTIPPPQLLFPDIPDLDKVWVWGWNPSPTEGPPRQMWIEAANC